ncbi:hypothetical protein CBW56_05420, partial [Denitratisoma oestradiolicum]
MKHQSRAEGAAAQAEEGGAGHHQGDGEERREAQAAQGQQQPAQSQPAGRAGKLCYLDHWTALPPAPSPSEGVTVVRRLTPAPCITLPRLWAAMRRG